LVCGRQAGDVTIEHSPAVAVPDAPVGGVGIDLESIERFNLVTKPGGRAFFDRVYTSGERASASGNPVLLALYYTAKEAVAKALGTGLDLSGAAVSGKDIEIRWTPGEERPTVVLWRGAAARAESLHVSDVAVCWEHTPRLACAIAVGTDCPALLASLAAGLREALAAFLVSGEC
jgi:holo-[acyl-carrier protein] synthase